MLSWEGWAGRRVNLDQVALGGNGQLTMTDCASGKVIYRTSFSSLFQEWLSGDEAKTTNKGYEFTILTPLPLAEAEVCVTLRNSLQEVVASLNYRINPTDILIRNVDGTPTTPHRLLHQSGYHTAQVGLRLYREGVRTTDEELTPVYLRLSQAERVRLEKMGEI
jgi:hypothetical protein